MLALRKLFSYQEPPLYGGKEDPEVPEKSRMSGVCFPFEPSGQLASYAKLYKPPAQRLRTKPAGKAWPQYD